MVTNIRNYLVTHLVFPILIVSVFKIFSFLNSNSSNDQINQDDKGCDKKESIHDDDNFFHL